MNVDSYGIRNVDPKSCVLANNVMNGSSDRVGLYLKRSSPKFAELNAGTKSCDRIVCERNVIRAIGTKPNRKAIAFYILENGVVGPKGKNPDDRKTAWGPSFDHKIPEFDIIEGSPFGNGARTR